MGVYPVIDDSIGCEIPDKDLRMQAALAQRVTGEWPNKQGNNEAADDV